MDTSAIAYAIIESLGERCPDFAPDCATCRAWAEYDAILARVTALEAQVKAADGLVGIEWKGKTSYDGRFKPCCPWCGGVHPDHGYGFIKSAVGHKADCPLSTYRAAKEAEK